MLLPAFFGTFAGRLDLIRAHYVRQPGTIKQLVGYVFNPVFQQKRSNRFLPCFYDFWPP